MKCTKCGYVSFDHLSECKKCRTSLTAARDAFGISAGKPAVPFLLGSLLNDYEPSAQLDTAAAETETRATAGFVQRADEAFRQVEPEKGAKEIASAVAGSDGLEEDFSLLDLSDEELDLLVDKESLESDGMSALLSETDANGTSKSSPELFSATEPFPSTLEISLPDEEPSSSTARASDVEIKTFEEFSRGLESARLAPEETILPPDDFPPKLESAEQTPEGVVQSVDELSHELEPAAPAPEGTIQIPDDFPPILESAEQTQKEVVQTVDELSLELEPAAPAPEEAIQIPDDFPPILESAEQTPEGVVQTVDELPHELEPLRLAPEAVIQPFEDFPPKLESVEQTPEGVVQTVDEFSRRMEPLRLALAEVIQPTEDFPRELESAERTPEEVAQMLDQFSRGLEPAAPAREEVSQPHGDLPLELESKPKAGPSLELPPEYMADPEILEEKLEAPDDFKLDPKMVPPRLEDPTDDFVIELSENDLETLLEELGSTPKGAT